MGAMSNYLENKLTDLYWRAQAFTPPATHYFGLLTSTHGPRANSTGYALNNTISLTATDGKVHLYKCTTAGTTAASQGSLYPGVADEVITDGTAVFTEQTAGLEAATAAVEPSGGSYARVGVAASLANFAGTQSSGSTTASSGTAGTTSNNNSVTFASPTANWGYVWGMATYDASSAGNLMTWGPLNTVKTVNNGDAAPSVAAAGFTFQWDN